MRPGGDGIGQTVAPIIQGKVLAQGGGRGAVAARIPGATCRRLLPPRPAYM